MAGFSAKVALAGRAGMVALLMLMAEQGQFRRRRGRQLLELAALELAAGMADHGIRRNGEDQQHRRHEQPDPQAEIPTGATQVRLHGRD
jgi:hypothetical protein